MAKKKKKKKNVLLLNRRCRVSLNSGRERYARSLVVFDERCLHIVRNGSRWLVE